MTAGSCFAANLLPFLPKYGLNHVKTEYTHWFYSDIESERFSYHKFSAGYGNIYTSRQLLQLLLRSKKKFVPIEDRWSSSKYILDPFRPGLRYPARNNFEFDILLDQHLRNVRRAFKLCTAIVFTLGLTECWISRSDGAVYPACPGTLAGTFDSTKYQFKNLSASEVIEDLVEFSSELRSENPAAKLILTVSPVPLVATATDNHVLLASTYSKSVLRVAAEEVAKRVSNTVYFPSYEIITGPQAPNFFEADMRSVTPEGVATVMQAFFESMGLVNYDVATYLADHSKKLAAELSSKLTEIECEEMSSMLS